MDVELRGLQGTNPLGFLAAIGALSVAERMATGGTPARLSWSEEAAPTACLHADASDDDLVALVLGDREAWRGSPVLDYPAVEPAGDVKFSHKELRAWLAACASAAPIDGGRALGLVSALVAEGSYTDAGKAKPTDLHFTAGRQQFLAMARQLRDELTDDHVREALFGPWRYASTLPSFKWDIADDRTYALSAVNPADEKKLTVPGAEWLGLLGLTLLPVTWRPRGAGGTAGAKDRASRKGRTVTTGCSGTWENGTFSWPLWSCPLTVHECRTLLGLRELTDEPPRPALLQRGVSRVLRSVITRSDQGGYGSFRPPVVVLDAAVHATV